MFSVKKHLTLGQIIELALSLQSVERLHACSCKSSSSADDYQSYSMYSLCKSRSLVFVPLFQRLSTLIKCYFGASFSLCSTSSPVPNVFLHHCYFQFLTFAPPSFWAVSFATPSVLPMISRCACCWPASPRSLHYSWSSYSWSFHPSPSCAAQCPSSLSSCLTVTLMFLSAYVPTCFLSAFSALTSLISQKSFGENSCIMFTFLIFIFLPTF